MVHGSLSCQEERRRRVRQAEAILIALISKNGSVERMKAVDVLSHNLGISDRLATRYIRMLVNVGRLSEPIKGFLEIPIEEIVKV